MAMARVLAGRQSHRGGERRSLRGPLGVRHSEAQAAQAQWWTWRECVSAGWRQSGEHINLLESRAYALALRWRFRVSRNIGTRFVHLVDSQVLMSAAAKGRSFSRKLNQLFAGSRG